MASLSLFLTCEGIEDPLDDTVIIHELFVGFFQLKCPVIGSVPPLLQRGLQSIVTCGSGRVMSVGGGGVMIVGGGGVVSVGGGGVVSVGGGGVVSVGGGGVICNESMVRPF